MNFMQAESIQTMVFLVLVLWNFTGW